MEHGKQSKRAAKPQSPISPDSHHKQASMEDKKIKKKLQKDQAIYREGAMLINRRPAKYFTVRENISPTIHR